MDNFLLWLGRAAGAGGAAMCVAVGLARLAGHYWIGGFQTGTLMQAGIAAMAFGSFCLLVLLTRRSKAG